MLAVNYLNKSFGGLQANQNINFEVAEGEILGVIGPNGAGKSTLFDLVTGFEKPDSGDVLFLGKSILGLRPDQINRLGIGRTFQKLKPFPQMTVEENVMVGLMQHVSQMNEAREEAHRYLEFVGLIDKRSVYAHGLSTGQRKRLELARAMASRPKLLLLDEVTGGVDQKTVPELVSLVERLRTEGTTVVLIEHNMKVLMSLADHVVALHLGQQIAYGRPQEIQAHKQVIESYLGASYA
jgi:branched-chain amino acid transport system ATP-binding protein